MATIKQSSYGTGIKILAACVFVLLSVLIVLYYFKFNRLQFFLKGVYQVRIIRSYSSDKVQKLVYYSDSKSSKTLLTNSTLDQQTAIELPSVPETDFLEVSVPFYKNNYFVIRYGIGEGGSDFLIFDQNGKIITRALIAEADKSQLQIPTPYFYEPSIVGQIGYDAILTLKFPSNLTGKSYYATFDITTGKLKNVTSQP